MASQPPPGSTGGEPRTPPAPSAPAAPRVSQTQRCVLLAEWWLERVEGQEAKVRVAGFVDAPQMRNSAARRVFRSAAIAKRHDDTAIETEEGYRILISRLLNTRKTRENGFSEKVCEWFLFGFPIQWLELVDPNMEQQNAQAQSQSESTANAPRHSVEYYMEKLSSDEFTKSIKAYAFTENDFYSSAACTCSKDGPAIQSLSNLTDGIAGKMAALGPYGNRTNMPEKPLTPPGETCSSDQHGSMQMDASEQGLISRPICSVSVNQTTGSICTNSKVHSIVAPSKIVSAGKEGYRSRVGFGQAEEDADIQENVQICSSEQEKFPIDSAIVNGNMNSASSDLEEPRTPKCGKGSVHPEITDALEIPTERMTPQFGVVQGSEDSTVRRLRSGKVYGTPSGGPVKAGYKKQKIQHAASSKNMVPNERSTSTADLTSHENDSSAAGIVTEEKPESHDSHNKRQGRPVKKTRKKKTNESKKLFWNWL